MKQENIRSYIVVFEEEVEGGYSVSVPALPGCFSQGDTFEEARKNIEEAMQLYIEDPNEDVQAHIRSRGAEIVASVSV